MKSFYPFLFILIIPMYSLAQNLPEGYPKTDRQKLRINRDWKFHLDETNPQQLSYQLSTSDWKSINLPHTLSLTDLNLNGYKDDEQQLTFQRQIGWYAKELFIPEKKGMKYFLEFEGVHQNTTLWVNGRKVGNHSIGGYTPFHFDITDFINPGSSNTILISADNRVDKNIPPDGHTYDYIKWGGLYRDVYLVVTNPVRITFPWEGLHTGVTITTPTVSQDHAVVSVKTHVQNHSNQIQQCTLQTRVIDEKGMVVWAMTKTATIDPNQSHLFSQTDGLKEIPHLWSCDNPYLYRVNSLVMIDGKQVDCVENPLGIRWFEFIKDQGFFLNGENIELIGANRHQAYPFIGDAVPNSLHWKDAYQFKEAGYNVVRLAHYPHDDAFIQACDKLGILIFEEPPTWIGIGGEIWMANLEEATRRMIRNHRNHPSILMWAAAINHRGPVERLHYAAKEEDPTRPTASNGSPWTGPRTAGITDIYAPMDYQNMPIYDNDISFLCEHGATGDASRQQYEVARSRASKNRIGVAVWTAHDYHAFKPGRGMYPRRTWTWYRYPNPPFYWYQSELRPEPMIHIVREDVRPADQVLVFSNCQEVALYQDDQLIAIQKPDRNPQFLALHHPPFTFDYIWSTGTLEARGLIDGKVVRSTTLKKAVKPVRIQLVYESDNQSFYANGSDIKVVRALIMDESGTLVESDSSLITFNVSGEGTLVGEQFPDANPNQAIHGIATGFVQSSGKPGKISITASAPGLQADKIEIATVQDLEDQILATAKPIYDWPRVQIDMGGEEQLTQFGWEVWDGGAKNTREFELVDFEKAKLNINVEEDKHEWTTGWGLSGPLPYLAMDGVVMKPGEPLELNILDLPLGTYELSTFHHIYKKNLKPTATIQITVNDAQGEHEVASSFKPTSGNILYLVHPSSKSYLIYSDGKNPIQITVMDSTGKMPVSLNGLKLKQVSQAIPSNNNR